MKKISTVILMLGGLLILGGCTTSPRQKAATTKQVKSQVVTTQRQTLTSRKRQKIVITINHQQLTAHLNQSSAAQAFAKKLPTTLRFRDYPGLPEKIADLGYKLPVNGMPSGHAGTRGSIGYWSPQRRIVFYWGTEDYYEGIHIIGHFDTTAYRRVVRHMGNHVPVTIRRVAS